MMTEYHREESEDSNVLLKPNDAFTLMGSYEKKINTSNNDCNCQSTVLIVDDNMFNLIPLELILKEMFQIQVDKAFDGKEAVDKFSINLNKKCCNVYYRLIFMDISMPIMDGYEATNKILSMV